MTEREARRPSGPVDYTPLEQAAKDTAVRQAMRDNPQTDPTLINWMYDHIYQIYQDPEKAAAFEKRIEAGEL